MTSGADRPPNGCFQITFPLAPAAGSNSPGRFFSRENPFCSGPRQWIQSAASAGVQSAKSTVRRANPSRRVMCVSVSRWEGVSSNLLVSLHPDDAAGLHLEPRQGVRRHGADLDAEEQLVADRPAD